MKSEAIAISKDKNVHYVGFEKQIMLKLSPKLFSDYESFVSSFKCLKFHCLHLLLRITTGTSNSIALVYEDTQKTRLFK